MTESLFDSLRCPFCGGHLTLHDSVRRAADATIDTGVVWCECCAFPVVAGIPVLTSDEASRAALQAIEAGRDEEALLTLLGLDAARADGFRALFEREDGPTYQEAIGILSPDPEGTYFTYRFSDPTFVLAEGVLGALAQEPSVFRGPILDLCGGSGHLTRVLARLRPAAPVVLADMFFWKLWLAKTITANGRNNDASPHRTWRRNAIASSQMEKTVEAIAATTPAITRSPVIPNIVEPSTRIEAIRYGGNLGAGVRGVKFGAEPVG